MAAGYTAVIQKDGYTDNGDFDFIRTLQTTGTVPLYQMDGTGDDYGGVHFYTVSDDGVRLWVNDPRLSHSNRNLERVSN